ncbi:MAG: MFS transporter [Clostridia bacterium]|nr:MFS transporter [Clostridia bacterium]
MNSSKPNYKRTMYSCFVAYIDQAIVASFAPLLFVMFHRSYGIPLSKITLLITINFVVQISVDLLCVKFVDKIGYRAAMILAHLTSAAGFIGLAFLPDLFADPFTGLLIATMVYAIGGGLLEVVVSPIVESCPTDNKEMAMSMLHSFFCWGCLAVVLLTTAFFKIFGIENWKVVACLWAVLPLANMVSFFTCPIAPLLEEGEKGLSVRELLRNRNFWIIIVLMACAGASELSVSQWASTFAESTLGISKTLGDIMGPAFFALLMGISRTVYGKFGDKIDLSKFMTGSAVLCIIAYIMISLVPVPAINLIGCGIAGFSVGIFWPGTFSRAAATIRGGGTAMFAIMALFGDLGCSGGPTLVGEISSLCGDNLSVGLAFGMIFPIVMIIGLIALDRRAKKG